MGLIAYGVIALAIIGSLGGIAWKLDSNGYERGAGNVKAQWDAAVQKAAADVAADRARQEAARAAQDKQATRRLQDAKARSRTLMVSLDAHIRAAKLPSSCRIPGELLNDANDALRGGKSERTGTVPRKPPAVTPTR